MLRKKSYLICIFVVLIVIAFLNDYFRIYSINFVRPSKGDFRVLCYNIHSLGSNFGTDAPDISKLIIENNPDFVYLTEFYEAMGDTIDVLLSKNYSHAFTKFRWGNNDGNAFYSRWIIDSVRSYIVSGHYSSIYRVQIHKGVDTVAIFCCHLSSNNMKLNEGRWASLKEGRRLRLTEADTIVNDLQREKYPCIIMGDMNDVSGSTTMSRLEDAGFEDAWWDGGFGYGSTFHSGWLRLRIDHILYDKHFRLADVYVLHADYSDHDALVGSFNMERK